MKAIVVKSQIKKAVLLREDGVFVHSSSKNHAIGDVVTMNPVSKRKSFAALAAVAAAMIVLIAVGAFAYGTPFYYVSVDVNPGVVFEVNRFERVLSAQAVNEEAKEILSGVKWKNQKVDDIIPDIARAMEENGYLANEGEILLATAGKNEKKAVAMTKRLADSIEELGLDDVDVSAEAIGYDMVQSAKAFSMTPGKYNIITKLLGENIDETNVDYYRNTSVKDLMKAFTDTKGAHGKEIAADAKDNGSKNADAARQRTTQARQETQQQATETRQEATQARQETRQQVTETRQKATSIAQDTKPEEPGPQQEAQQNAPDISPLPAANTGSESNRQQNR